MTPLAKVKRVWAERRTNNWQGPYLTLLRIPNINFRYKPDAIPKTAEVETFRFERIPVNSRFDGLIGYVVVSEEGYYMDFIGP